MAKASRTAASPAEQPVTAQAVEQPSTDTPQASETPTAASPAEQPVTAVTVEPLRSSASDPESLVDPRLVKVVVKYPEGYQGDRYLEDGKQYDVSRETADHFVAIGIATEVTK